ncbi:MAG: DUF1295 domain-containing protein [Candidatus Lokiarchaeota archaeon]|nr:DUF1295 domain-containing protein [Candidatus Lokiarchaeota archaeon]
MSKRTNDWWKDMSLIAKLNLIVMMLSYVGLFVSGFFVYNDNGIEGLRILGWIIFGIGIILSASPNLYFKKHGGVEKGESYIKTTKLVRKGIYDIIRHPQYTGGFWCCVGITLVFQHWIPIILTLIAVPTIYYGMFPEEESLIEKFGDKYKQYMQDVPRWSISWGLVRKLRRQQQYHLK